MKILTTMLLIGATTFMSCTSNGQEAKSKDAKIETQKEVKSISKDVSETEFDKFIAEKEHVLVDVRTPNEFNAGHIKNAININVNSNDFMDKMADLKAKDVTVLVYCRSGARSGKAMKMLNKDGYSEVYNLLGGYMNYSNK